MHDAFDPLTGDDPGVLVARALRLARSRLRLSQRELAAFLGVDRGTVGRWETGDAPPALLRVNALLRMVGFRLVVVPLDPDEWVGVDPRDGFLVDRARRLFPAHLEPAIGADSLNEWVRYRGKQNRWAPDWTYRMDPERRAEVRAMLDAGFPSTVAVDDDHGDEDDGGEDGGGEDGVGPLDHPVADAPPDDID